jgi:hypothetical protein
MSWLCAQVDLFFVVTAQDFEPDGCVLLASDAPDAANGHPTDASWKSMHSSCA